MNVTDIWNFGQWPKITVSDRCKELSEQELKQGQCPCLGIRGYHPGFINTDSYCFCPTLHLKENYDRLPLNFQFIHTSLWFILNRIDLYWIEWLITFILLYIYNELSAVYLQKQNHALSSLSLRHGTNKHNVWSPISKRELEFKQ